MRRGAGGMGLQYISELFLKFKLFDLLGQNYSKDLAVHPSKICFAVSIHMLIADGKEI